MNPLELLDSSPEGLAGYTVLKHLGSGATADVFQVTAKNNERSYVLKQMPLANMSDEEKLRAKQEILVMDGVDHPNVVKFHESFSSDTSVDIVMEYCEGGTLEHLIERQRHEGTPFPEEVLIEWMAELLCALAHIHSKRILHRDLKTGNIFVTEKNHLKLGDFGVCTILTNANAKAESMIGTPLYFAPEVCENEAYDDRSDVWSLGIVFYEMCTLRRPFEADNLFSLIQKILTQEVAPFNTGLDITFEEIVRKMLSKDPVDRPNAQELIDDHLNVPKSHPSHPSQKPSRSRLIQQYYGPKLKYTKPWPPSSEEALARPEMPDKHVAAAAGRPRPSSAGKAAEGHPHRNGHNDAEDYISDEKDREKYKQLLNQTMGASLALAADAGRKKKDAVPTTGGSKAASSKPKSVKSSIKAAPSSAKTPKTAATTKQTGTLAHSTKPTATKAATAPATAQTADALATSQLDELKKDLARRRTEMFGEHDLQLDHVPVVIEIPERSIDAMEASGLRRNSTSVMMENSATVRSSSSFLEEIASILERHTEKGRKLKLEELDDAAQLLSQYKLTHFGLY